MSNSYLLSRRRSSSTLLAGGPPVFQTLIANPNGEGNDILAAQHNKAVESPGANAKLGWTIEISSDSGSTWRTIDLTSATVTTSGNLVKFDLGGLNRSSIITSHSFKVSYSSVTGDIRSVTSQEDLATFSDDETYENNSTADLMSDIEDWYKFEEGAGTTRTPEINGASYNLTDVSTVGIRTGASGSGNAASFTGANYLHKNALFDPPSNGKFTVAYYMILDTLPSVKASGSGYPVCRWRNTNARSWSSLIPETTSGVEQADTLYFAGQNSNDVGFAQHFKNKGALSTAQWYLIIGVYDPDASIPLIGYLQELNTPASFVVEDDNYIAPSSGTPQAKQSTGTCDLQVGDVASIGVHQGFAGGVDTLIKWDRALTEVEARALAEYYGEPDSADAFIVDTL